MFFIQFLNTFLNFLIDWKADAWRFKQSGTSSFDFTDEDGEVVRCQKVFDYTYLGKKNKKAVLSAKFKREVYHNPNYPLRFLINYVGDASVQISAPHGNAKSEDKLSRPFVSTRKSKLEQMKSKTGSVGVVYKELVTDAAGVDVEEHRVTAPRDRKQVENAQTTTRRELRVSHDGFFNLHTLGHETKFIRYLVTIPDLICLMWSTQMWTNVLGLLNRKDIPNLCFSFNTTFDLGDCYVSCLVVRFEEFRKGPIIPLMYMIHERKLKDVHAFFYKKICEYFPQVIFKYLFSSFLPRLNHFYF